MLKKIVFVSLIVMSNFISNAQIYIGTEKTLISFYSHTPLEDIFAKTNKVKPVLNSATGEFAVKFSNRGFEFKNGLMQEHFNENYMESEKYPYNTFTGKIIDTIDYTKDGTYKITMDGTLEIHGVKKPRKIAGTMTIKGNEIVIDSKFKVTMKDHDIKIPEAVGNKFAEAMEVTVKAVLKKKI